MAGPNARARRGLCRDRIRGGHERIGSVIDIEERTLGPFKQNALSGLALFIEKIPGHIHVGEDLGGDFCELGNELVFGDLLFA